VLAGTGLLVLLPLTLAGNIFVDPRTMPGWLHWVLFATGIITVVFAPLTARLHGRLR
jgi:hypothetical protein